MSKIPVNVLTGFLGSCKTTLLRHLLASPAFAGCAVLINEFGEVALDHELIEAVDGEVVLLRSGCLCCTVRADLIDTMRMLYRRREAGEVPPFERLVIETTGLADPVPILATVINDDILRHHFRLGNVVTTVDALNADLHLSGHSEAGKQIAVADRIVITKTDLAEESEVCALECRLHRLNPAAPMVRAGRVPPAPALLLGRDAFAADGKAAEVASWLAGEARDPADRGPGGEGRARHDADIAAFAFTFAGQIDWTVFGVWLTLLLQAHGENVLRVKGLLNVRGAATPVVVHGVQHLVYPPTHLARWPGDERTSRLVFITRGLARRQVERSFDTFQHTLGRVTPAPA